jgi:type IV secretion system protein VirD4
MEERSLSRPKIILAAALVLAALIAGNYLSGGLTLLLLGLDTELMKFSTYWQYVRALDPP